MGDVYALTLLYVARPDSLGLYSRYYKALTNRDLAADKATYNAISKAQDVYAQVQKAYGAYKAASDARDSAQHAYDKAQAAYAQSMTEQNRALAEEALKELIEAQKEQAKAQTEVAALPDPKNALADLTGKIAQSGWSDPTAAYSPITQADWYLTVSRKKDIPKKACYVGHSCDVWVWVPPESATDFTLYTFAMLDLASFTGVQVPARPIVKPKPPAGLKFSPLVELPETEPKVAPNGSLYMPPAGPLLTPRVNVFPYPSPPQ